MLLLLSGKAHGCDNLAKKKPTDWTKIEMSWATHMPRSKYGGRS